MFLGHWSPESLGDYCSGPNHILPTYGYAQGLQRPVAARIFRSASRCRSSRRRACASLGPTAQILAQLEGLDAHAAAVSIRLAALRRSAPR